MNTEQEAALRDAEQHGRDSGTPPEADTDDRGPLTPEDLLAEIVEEWEAIKEDPEDGEDVSFFGAIQHFFWTQFDELHDSRGDVEYQRSVIETIIAIRSLFLGPHALRQKKTAAERIAMKEQVAKYLLDILNAEIDEEDVTDGVEIPEVI